MPGLFGKAKSLFNDEVEQWKRSFNLLGGIPKTFKNNPRNAETMDAVFGFGGIVPGVGDAASVIEAKYRYDQGDKLGAGLAGIGALPLVPNVAGMFIGKGAKTWDALKHAEALKMEEAGKHPRVIWAETGNWKAPDGMWRQEIPDNAAAMESGGRYFGSKGGGGKVSQVLDHESLYSAYPDVRDINANFEFGAPRESGAFNANANYITVHTPLGYKESKPILSHELQHAIQRREGFARGGSPEAMRSVLSSDPLLQSAYSQPELYDAYRRLLGEAEARATQARMNMDMPMRLAKFPEDSFDVPMDRLIIRGLLGD